MTIPLPIPAWWITLTPECDYDSSPLGKDYERYEVGLHEEPFPELYVLREFPESRLSGDPRVVRYKAVWYITPLDFTRPAEEIDGLSVSGYLFERLGGHYISNCGGAARIYLERAEALADLAKCDLGTGYVCQAARDASKIGKRLALSVLDGDLTAPPILADRLEEEGHPLAETIRELCAPPKKRRARKKR